MHLARSATHKKCVFRRPLTALIALCLCLSSLSLPRFVAAQELDLRLRITWGGGEPQAWQGSLQLPGGRFSEPQTLGLEADSSATKQLNGDTVQLAPRGPTGFDGLDVLATVPSLDTTLIVKLWNNANQQVRETTVSLAQFTRDANRSFHSLDLEGGNRLVIRRTHDDRLRVRFPYDSLLCTPGQKFEMEVVPHFTGLANAQLKCRVQLVHARTDDEIGTPAESDVRTGTNGSTPAAISTTLTLPESEGVYDVVISLIEPSFRDRFVKPKPLLQRRVQLVVLAAKTPEPSGEKWQSLGEIDPTKPQNLLNRVRNLPQFVFPKNGPHEPVSSRTKSLNDRQVQIERGGWLALPLPIDKPGRPHVVEVEFPTDRVQTLGVSIVEPNRAGKVLPIGLDSGVDVPEPEAAGQRGKHRLVFWPRGHHKPYLLITNHHPEQVAVCGLVRVLAGPNSLPPLPPRSRPEDERLAAAYFDKPLLPECFTADEALDNHTQQSLDDWVTFYTAGRRLVEHLKYAGYNGAVINVLSDGSTLYPSQLVQPTPKYDTGTFFFSGQDPVRKDVLEMLFRMFDREKLRLIPGVQFATPLPELEELASREQDASMQLVDADGRSWLEMAESQYGLAPYYNPLNVRVQTAMRHVLTELAGRYGRHASFAGMSVRLGPESYAQLPNELWGCDERTLRQFTRETNVRLPPIDGSVDVATQRTALTIRYLLQPPAELNNRDAWLRCRESWLKWRASKLTALYQQMQKDVEHAHAGARLYLASAELFASGRMHAELWPRLGTRPRVDQALLGMGLNAPEIQSAGIELLRPYRLAPVTSLSDQAVNLVLESSAEVTAAFAQEKRAQRTAKSSGDDTERGAVPTGALLFHEQQSLSLPSFDEASPFGKDHTQMRLVSQITPNGFHARRQLAHNLAAFDVPTIWHGGWMLPRGQEDFVKGFLDVYRDLPAEPFTTLPASKENGSGQPLVVRGLVRGNQTYFYVVNDSPFPAAANLQFHLPPNTTLTGLGGRTWPTPKAAPNGPPIWTLNLAPYELHGAAANHADARLVTWWTTPNPTLVSQLQVQMQETRRRARALENPPPLPVLPNGNFELPAMMGIPGWIVGPGGQAALDRNQPGEGMQSLQLTSSEMGTTLTSQPFAAGKAGRLSILVMVRTPNPAQQPVLKLKLLGIPGAESVVRPLTQTWGQFVLPIERVPANAANLRVELELVGAGEVGIDNVQVFDLWFPSNERSELIKHIGTESFSLDRLSAIGDCQRFLNGYWPRFLLENVKVSPQVATLPRPTTTATPTPNPAPNPNRPQTPPPREAKKPGWSSDLLKKFTPSNWLR